MVTGSWDPLETVSAEKDHAVFTRPASTEGQEATQVKLQGRVPVPPPPNTSHGRDTGALNSPQGSRNGGGGTAGKALTEWLSERQFLWGPQQPSRYFLGGGRVLPSPPAHSLRSTSAPMASHAPQAPPTHALPENEATGLPSSLDKHLLGACCMPALMLGTGTQC